MSELKASALCCYNLSFVVLIGSDGMKVSVTDSSAAWGTGAQSHILFDFAFSP